MAKGLAANRETGRPAGVGMPAPSSDAVSARMRRVRTRGTGPELALRSALHARGLRYRVNRQLCDTLRCRPDVAFAPARVVVFVDGCFWHGCPMHASWPKANAAWWRAKIEKTRARDALTAAALAEQGWLVIRVWEHDDPVDAADRVELAVRSRRP